MNFTKNSGGHKESLLTYIRETRYEISRLENTSSDLTSKSGFLLSAVSLISIIPFTNEMLTKFFIYYLSFIFPFLIIGLVASLVAIRRRFTYRAMTNYSQTGLEETIENLELTAQLSERIILEEEENYRRSLRFYRIANASISIFLFLYTLNIYSFLTNRLDINTGPKQLLLSLIALILFLLLQSKFWSSTEKTRIYTIKSSVGGPTS